MRDEKIKHHGLQVPERLYKKKVIAKIYIHIITLISIMKNINNKINYCWENSNCIIITECNSGKAIVLLHLTFTLILF